MHWGILHPAIRQKAVVEFPLLRRDLSKPLQTQKHWSKNIFEHLRDVHFARVAVSAGLIVLTLSEQIQSGHSFSPD
jgi:hypothetical protein